MFIKLSFVDESKKLVFKEEYKNPASLRAVVTKLKGYADDEFDLVFIDMENEQITLRDELDMAYFLEQVKDGRKYLELMVINKPEEEPEFKIVEKAEQSEEEKENDYDVVLKSEVVEEKKAEEPIVEVEELGEEVKEEIPFDEQIVPALAKKLENNDVVCDFAIEQVEPENQVVLEENLPELGGKVIVEITPETTVVEHKEEKEPITTEDVEPVPVEDKEPVAEPKEEASSEEERLGELPFDNFFGGLFKSIGHAVKEHRKKLKEQKKIRNKNKKKQQKKCVWLAKHPKNEPEVTVHMNIYCDGCNVGPIVGKRFNCMVCPDFDFCESCEAKKMHNHPMMRLNTPMQQWKLHKLKKKFSKVNNQSVHPLGFFPFRGFGPRGGCGPKHGFGPRGGFGGHGPCIKKPHFHKQNNQANNPEERADKLQMLNFMLGDTINQQEKEALVDKHPNLDIIKFAKFVKKAYKN